MGVPHPFPYQGSKRAIASRILPFLPKDSARLVEPFCGSAAVSIAAASRNLATDFWLNDLDDALMTLWTWILERPLELTAAYARLWDSQHPNRKEFFFEIRDEFNSSHQPHHFLYLLARIVKGSVRYSSRGMFNQSPDNRRSGMRPAKMRRHILEVSALLRGKTELSASDFRDMLPQMDSGDVVYMDPPYQGTSFTRDHRYYRGVLYDDLVDTLSAMNDMRISYMLSYDGQTGGKRHGKPLPDGLRLAHRHIHAGRSSQATLLGDNRETIESLYLSPALVERLREQSAMFGNTASQSRRRHSQERLALAPSAAEGR